MKKVNYSRQNQYKMDKNSLSQISSPVLLSKQRQVKQSIRELQFTKALKSQLPKMNQKFGICKTNN